MSISPLSNLASVAGLRPVALPPPPAQRPSVEPVKASKSSDANEGMDGDADDKRGTVSPGRTLASARAAYASS